MKTIKTSSHSVKFTNRSKLSLYQEFLRDYRNAVEYYVNYIFDRLPQDLNVQKYMSTVGNVPSNTKLSARALKCASTQAIGIVRATIEKQRKTLYINSTKQKTLTIGDFSKPSVQNVPAELNSICCDYVALTDSEFDGFIQLKSIGKHYGKIRIPIKNHRHSNKISQGAILKNSFLFRDEFVDFRWERELPNQKETGKVIGIDQGIKKVYSTSEGEKSKPDTHGHDLTTIIKKISRKKKGSKAFQKAIEHRKNYINWAINELNLNGVFEVRLEKIKNLRKGKKSSRFLSHFAYTTIKEKIEDVCSSNGVRFIEQDNVYRSQRCFNCGFVHKSNRKLEEFNCLSCGHCDDSDLNAAKNLAIDLPSLSRAFVEQRHNRSNGFFFRCDEVVVNEEFTVSRGKKSK